MTKLIYCLVAGVLAICLLVGFAADVKLVELGECEKFVSWVTSPVALLSGLIFALIFGKTFPDFTKLMSKKLLQYSVIGLGFGMNLFAALQSGSEGMLFTIVSVFGTLALGYVLGRKLLKVDSQTSYLISSGTAICGGSAIAAVGPVIKAKAESMSVALGVVFVLNAVALFIFPEIGAWLEMSMKDFGMWSAIAIHDTSSVVGAGAAYDQLMANAATKPADFGSVSSALEVATTVKLTRALWIVVIALITPFFFRSSQTADGGAKKPWYKSIPTFIIWFVVAILFNTYILSNADVIGSSAAEVGRTIGSAINKLAKHLITLSLFFIGAGLTRETLRAVGLRPLFQGILLWVIISVVSLTYISLV